MNITSSPGRRERLNALAAEMRSTLALLESAEGDSPEASERLQEDLADQARGLIIELGFDPDSPPLTVQHEDGAEEELSEEQTARVKQAAGDLLLTGSATYEAPTQDASTPTQWKVVSAPMPSSVTLESEPDPIIVEIRADMTRLKETVAEFKAAFTEFQAKQDKPQTDEGPTFVVGSSAEKLVDIGDIPLVLDATRVARLVEECKPGEWGVGHELIEDAVLDLENDIGKVRAVMMWRRQAERLRRRGSPFLDWGLGNADDDPTD